MLEDSPVLNNESANRFESHVGEHLAFLTYRRSGQEIAFTHAEVPQELEGRGLGGRVVHAALEFARENALTVVPQCPFVAWYIRRHPEFAALVRPDFQSRVRA